jgi:hypothetical protein
MQRAAGIAGSFSTRGRKGKNGHFKEHIILCRPVQHNIHFPQPAAAQTLPVNALHSDSLSRWRDHKPSREWRAASIPSACDVGLRGIPNDRYFAA